MGTGTRLLSCWSSRGAIACNPTSSMVRLRVTEPQCSSGASLTYNLAFRDPGSAASGFKLTRKARKLQLLSDTPEPSKTQTCRTGEQEPGFLKLFFRYSGHASLASMHARGPSGGLGEVSGSVLGAQLHACKPHNSLWRGRQGRLEHGACAAKPACLLRS